MTPEEVEKFTGQLVEILEYVDKLPNPPSTFDLQPSTARSELREDCAVSSKASTQELLSNAPQTDGTSIKVPAVFGGEK